MNFLVTRFSDNAKSTLGLLHQKETKQFFSFTLEDEHQDTKIKGETRIPAGIYPLRIYKVDSPLTFKHRKAYGDWFKYHIEICDVPGFHNVYVHAGNDELHTEGCLLIGDTLLNHFITAKNQLQSSTYAVKRFYSLVYPFLERGGTATIEFRDEIALWA